MKYINRNIWSGVLFGIGLIAFVDEAVFHQILQWHHFYDKSSTEMGIISDGFFHAFSWFATIGGLFLFADLRRRNSLIPTIWVGGILIGAGGFQLYDGVIQHKLMKVHQIRYVDSLLVYDIVWNLLAVIMIVVGITFIIKQKSKIVGKGVST